MLLVKTSPRSRKIEAAVEARRKDELAPSGADDAVIIEFCRPGNGEKPARALALAIEREFGIRPRLVPSRGGVFEVTVGGKLVFSKKATWRLPDADEIFYHVRQLGR